MLVKQPCVTQLFSDWDVWHSINHWSNEETMLRFIDKIIVPYVSKTRKSLGLPSTYPALAIFDLFAAHRCKSVLEKLQDNNIHQKFVPGGCTGDLQPLDIKFNGPFKQQMKNKFTHWYAEKVMVYLQEGKEITDINVDLKLSVIKPLHATWMKSVVATMALNKDLIKESFTAAGIV